MDWGVGEYEHSARELEPAATVAVDIAGIAPGESVLDVGCGTGNAALMAARAGAVVTGVDPAERLVEVARARARDLGLDATFHTGDAQALELADGTFDAVLSVFAVIFAPDGESAVAELLRVARPGGRVVVSCWLGTAALSEAIGTAVRRLAVADPAPPAHPGAIDWRERSAVTAAFERHGAHVQVTEHDHHFSGASAGEYWDDLVQRHPLAVPARAALVRAGTYDDVRAEAVAILEQGNESESGFRVTSPYFVVRGEKPR
jgi:SAM-dependent methyltransferase